MGPLGCEDDSCTCDYYLNKFKYNNGDGTEMLWLSKGIRRERKRGKGHSGIRVTAISGGHLMMDASRGSGSVDL